MLLSEAQLLRRGRIIPEIGERGKDSGKLRDIFVQQVFYGPCRKFFIRDFRTTNLARRVEEFITI